MRADALVEVRRGLHERLLRRVDARGLEEVSRTERRLRVREEALAILREERHILPRGVLTKVINEVSDAVVGLGPIEFLLKDPEVTEVMVNGPDDVYVEREGRLEKVTDGLFEGEEAVLHVMGWGGGRRGCAGTRTWGPRPRGCSREPSSARSRCRTQDCSVSARGSLDRRSALS